MQSAQTILVVDAEASIGQVITEMLGDEGYIAIAARDRSGAIAAIQRRPPALVLLDALQDESDEPCLQNAIRRQHQVYVPIVTMTTYEPLAGHSARPYLLKPFTVDELLECVATYVPAPVEACRPTFERSHNGC